MIPTNDSGWQCRCALVAMAVCGPLLAAAANPAFTAVLAADKPAPSPAPTWDRAAAAKYLDGREIYWQSWDHAKKDNGTMCVSCHTQAPYALARPALRPALAEKEISAPEDAMLASIQKRVRAWDAMKPFYSDAQSGAGKEVESRNAEAVLNAIILSNYDAGRATLSPLALTAFDNAWKLQSLSGPNAGAWVWQNFAYTPWESDESQYHWAALMAVAVGHAPGRYRDDPKIVPNMTALLAFLQSRYEQQPLLNQVAALWAQESFSTVMTAAQKHKLMESLARLQHADGGWSLTDLGKWERRDKTPLETRSDGYATGLIVLVLEQAGQRADPRVAQGLAWLAGHQDKQTGAWPAWSLNKNRDPDSNVGLFMSDAATSYAVLALEAAQ